MLAEITSLAKGVTAARETAKLIMTASAKLESAELKIRVADLLSQMADLTNEVTELRQQVTQRESVTYANGVYWPKGNVNSGDPYCPRCLEARDRLIHMRYSDTYNRMYICNDCRLAVAC